MIELDGDRLAVLRPLLGDARLLALAGELAAGLRDLPASATGEQGKVLHRLCGGAASLGFAALAERLAEAEAAGRADLAADLAAVADLVVPALAARLHGGPAQR